MQTEFPSVLGHNLLVVIVVVWAATVGQPCNSIITCRVQFGQDTSQLCQRTGIDNVRHHLWLSTGTQLRVGLSPSLPVGTDDRKGIWPIKYLDQLSSKVLLRELGPSRSASLKKKPKQASRKKTVKSTWAMYSCNAGTSVQCTLTWYVGRNRLFMAAL